MESGLTITLIRHRLAISLIFAITVLALTVLFVFGRSKAPAHAAPPALPVEVVEVVQQDVPIYSEWIGTTEGLVNAEIKAQVTGYLMKQVYKEGSFVRKGELLFEIDPRPFQAALDQAKGQVAQYEGQVQQALSQVTTAEAQIELANSQLSQAQAALKRAEAEQIKTQLDVNKYRPLAEQRAVTQRDLDNAIQANDVANAEVSAAKAGIEAARAQLGQAKAQVSVATAGVATARGQLENARAAVKAAALNLGFTKITSPVDGIAGSAQAQVGNLVSIASPPLTTVSTVDPIKVYFTLSEQEYLNYSRPAGSEEENNGDMSHLQLELILADGKPYPAPGKFQFADREVDPKTGAIRLSGLFPNPGNALRPGQYGRVRAITNVKAAALLVPQRAVTELQGTYQVAVVEAENKVNIRAVKLGERTGSMWVVTEGLQLGEKVVAEGSMKVRPGMIVAPKPFAGTVPTTNQ
jgi:membrane fusion protein (multidrug efflux system)